MYNSDGYVLIDLTGVDITKTNQYLNGIYNRVLTVIDINKLALVINAGNLTPMAAVVHKKLNYYVITTALYIFTINSNDIIMIEESGEATVDVAIVPALLDGVKIADFTIGAVEGSLYAPEQQSEINDNITTDYTTWSSDKINSDLSAKANSADVYTKAQVDTALSGKADISDIPTKTSQLTNDSGFITSAQVPVIDDTAVSSSSVWSSYKTSAELGNKANSSDVYTKNEVDTALSSKADSADVYTKTQVDTALSGKEDTLTPIVLNNNLTYHTNCSIQNGFIIRYGRLIEIGMILKVTGNINNNDIIVSGLPRALQNRRCPRGLGTDQWYANTDYTSGGLAVDIDENDQTKAIIRNFSNITASSSSPKYIYMSFSYVTIN